jgi:hypothetical protein
MRLIFTKLFICAAILLNAQQPLERIFVEKFYVSDEADEMFDSDNVLKKGSITYRVYVDMLPGYQIQAVYGTTSHQMRVETSTKFFNNETRGATTPTFTKSQAASGTILLDSYLSLGAAAKDQIAIPKEADNGINTLVNKDKILQNEDPLAGIPLKVQDGMVPGTPVSIQFAGTGNDEEIFGSENTIPSPQKYIVNQKAYTTVGFAVGPDTLTNQVLIGQFTTDGTIEFEVNLQIRRISDLKVTRYVAREPIDLSKEEVLDTINLRYKFDPKMTNIDYVDYANNLTIYPNPVSERLFFATPLSSNKKSVEIFDVTGKLMHKENLPDVSIQAIDIAFLKAGNYFMNLTLDEKSIVKQFIKI